MPPANLEAWMWAEACEALARAERLQREFFRLGPPSARPHPNWEPPVDIFENGDELWIVAALPGVAAPSVEIGVADGILTISGDRRPPAQQRDAAIHRLEIPQGRFERRIALAERALRADAARRARRLPDLGAEARVKMTITDEANQKSQIKLPPGAMIILPVRGMVLFPGMVLPLSMGRPKSIAAAQEAVRSGESLGMLLQRKAETDDPGPADLHEVGTAAAVLRYLTAPDGTHHLVCQGQHRFRVLRFLEGYPFLAAQVEQLAESEVRTPELEARLVHLRRQAEEAIELLPQAPPELGNAIRQAPSAGALADLVASVMDIGIEEKQEVLEIGDIGTRLRRVSELMNYRLEVLRLTRQISDQTKEKVEGRNREYLLREQLKTIQKELGENDGRSEEIAALDEAHH